MKLFLTPSQLRHRITLQSPVSTADTYGGYSLSWTDIATVWAQIIPETGGESLQHGRLLVTQSLKIRIRYLDGIHSDCRILFEDRKFGIRAVINERERNEMLILFAEEITGV